jgi:hypothetical protein
VAQAPLESLGGILATTVSLWWINPASGRWRVAARSKVVVVSSTRRVATVMSDDPTRTAVKGEGQVKPSLSGFDVGDIALPDAARSIWRRHLGKPVFRNLVFVSTVSRTGPETALLFRTQTLLAHEPATRFFPQRSPRSRRSNRMRGQP